MLKVRSAVANISQAGPTHYYHGRSPHSAVKEIALQCDMKIAYTTVFVDSDETTAQPRGSGIAAGPLPEEPRRAFKSHESFAGATRK